MTEVIVKKFLDDAAVFCAACSGNHIFKPSQLNLLIYTLQALEVDSRLESAESTATEYCLLAVLSMAYDGEMYYEYVENMEQAEFIARGIPCENHGRWKGPFHDEACPLWAEEEET